MLKIQTIDKISSEGLKRFPYDDYEIASEFSSPDAILVRSSKLHEMNFPTTLKAIARAGAGVNNIPLDKCSDQGIVVFNTPGANANAVKELVLTGMLLSSRKIVQGINWSKSIEAGEEEIGKQVEKNKSNFKGPEIQGKTLGVIGLGAIGMLVANAADALGMKVIGYDPYISVDTAWSLSSNVKKAISLDNLLSKADYITLHVPLLDATKGFINESKFAIMKDGVRIMNFARGGLEKQADMLAALDSGKVEAFVTDFPDEQYLVHEKVICLPHLGASTPESESNCAVMAVDQVREYLENGNIKNSVNFPNCEMPRNGGYRIVIANKNVPNMVGQISSVLASENINIEDMINKHRDGLAFNIIDVNSAVCEEQAEKLRNIEGVIMARILSPKK
ncbi:phosphoglycerate dehydrogenase [Flammeovirgaceae bacterium SG7u.111]|nr:phosphoglycerate dehydrogenase [Flammeovirgaceae bacterium SG7u.132]WPO38502.1 phosphoglycerate dehydrogenase [Flammeovirgaceae bacterium SG7u.111]